MKIGKFLFCLIIFSLITSSVYSEIIKSDSLKIKRMMLYRVFYQNGKVFETNSFLKLNNLTGEAVDRYQGLSGQALWQTNGNHQWEHNFGYPRLGIGIWTAQFFDAPNLGTPFAFYGLFNAPFVRGKKLSWNYELEMGLAVNWKPFNPPINKTLL